MHAPPIVGTTERQVQELHNRFSDLSAEISACLDAVLTDIQRAPGNESAIKLARELVSAQYAVTQQLALLSGVDSRNTVRALPPQHSFDAYPRLLPPGKPIQSQPYAASHPAHAPPDTWQQQLARLEPAARPAASLSELLQQSLQATQPQQQRPQPQYYPPQQTQRARSLPVVELLPEPIQANSVPGNVWTTQTPYYERPQTAAQPQPTFAQAEYAAPEALANITSTPTPSQHRKTSEVPDWIAPTVAGLARRYSPARAATGLLLTLAVLILMLNAGDKPQQVIASTPPVEATAAEPPHHDQQNHREQQKRVVTKWTPAASEEAQPAPAEEPQARAVTDEAAMVQQDSPPSPPPVKAETPPPQLPANKYISQDTFVSTGALVDTPAPRKPAPASQPRAQQQPEPTATTPAPAAAPKSAPVKVASKKPDTPPAAPSVQDKPAAAKPAQQVAPFKTAVVKTETKEQFAPVLLELKNADSLQRVFQDLQKRYPAALANKRAEVRPVAGPENETWFALVAVPATPKEEAEATCRDMGAEGKSLGCRVMRY